LREVIDALVLERSHVELENDDVGVGTLDGLAGSCHQAAKSLLLGTAEGCVRGAERISKKTKIKSPLRPNLTLPR